MNLYTILGVSNKASQDEIQKAYRKKAKQVHPDHGGNSEDFHKIQYAYQILSNPNKRAQYDKTGYLGQEENELLRNAYSFIKSKINEFLNKQNEMFEIDLISNFISQCHSDKLQCKVQIKNLEKKKKFLQKTWKKFKKKGKNSHDPIGEMFRENLSQIDNAINEKLMLIEVLDYAVNIISDYEFEFTKYLEEGTS